MAIAPGFNRECASGLGRAFAGAVISGLPLFMTMEMWAIGLFIEPLACCFLSP